ncbi:MAG TPA: M20/M25/M40 family metallo-hydrolase [Candidatus Saccharimonadales bacterium]|jgi:acetylornithine deacetylase/succinyl-diaminopimelate desuccinylase-like protein|nr:M20/M25/M40 family metallo-hydrolase [Candidatus Saccharimonadales bacterium]
MSRFIVRSFLLIMALAGSVLAQQAAPDFGKAQQEALQFLTGLIKIDTSNPPGNETRAAEYIKGVLAAEGIPAQIYESAPGRGNLVARLKGSGKKKPFLLMGHIDVVGVERDKWSVDPFAAIIKDGYIYGRGSHDDKAMDAANLEVFLLLHRLKVPLDRDVILLAEAGEEGTTQFGIDYMVANHWETIECEYALNEGGGVPEENGKVLYVGVSTAEKVPRGIILKARGTSGHGSAPRLDNAIAHLAAAVSRVANWEAPMRLNETTRRFFEQLAKIGPPERAQVYAHVQEQAAQQKLREREPAYYSMLRTSLVPTIIQGGFRSNVIPAEAEARFDVRALPDENMDTLKAELTKLINDPAVQIIDAEGGNARPATPPSGLGTDAYKALEHAQQKVFPGVQTIPIMQVGATDSSELRAKGVQAYGVGAPMSAEDQKRIHGNDERVDIAGFGKFVEFLYAAAVEIAGK